MPWTCRALRSESGVGMDVKGKVERYWRLRSMWPWCGPWCCVYAAAGMGGGGGGGEI